MCVASLVFARAGQRTQLLRQYVPYPFHITRPFYLDPLRPDLAALYLQSSSGGIYRGECLGLDVSLGRHAAVSLTTQAATSVRDCHGEMAFLKNHFKLAERSLFFYHPDPVILFPGALLRAETVIELPRHAAAVIQDAFFYHSPSGKKGRFVRYETETLIKDTDGKVLVSDRGYIDGADMETFASVLGPYRASGTVYLLNVQFPCGAHEILKALQEKECLGGMSALPNDAGIAIRVLAMNGGALARGMERLFEICFAAVTGVVSAPRRK